MKALSLLFALLLLLSADVLHGQIILHGKVMEQGTNKTLYPVTVKNKSTQAISVTDMGGNYLVLANTGDVIVFSYIGYDPDSITVKARNDGEIRDIYLVPRSKQLPEVRIGVLDSYQRDSLERAKEFGDYLTARKVELMDTKKSPLDADAGFGLAFHPLTHFSKAERRKRRFSKMYRQFETNAFINTRYTPFLVTRLTGMKDDSLRHFMDAHRPSYHFTRVASDLEFDSWIKKEYEGYTKRKRK